MHGDLAAAWHANAYALCMLPVIGFMVLLELVRERYCAVYKRVNSPGVIVVISVSVLAWWVIRNVVVC